MPQSSWMDCARMERDIKSVATADGDVEEEAGAEMVEIVPSEDGVLPRRMIQKGLWEKVRVDDQE